jgi:hypothetical protein
LGDLLSHTLSYGFEHDGPNRPQQPQHLMMY